MARFTGVAFALGGLGLVLFLVGLGFTFLAPPDGACGENLVCQTESFDRLQGRVLFAWVTASLLLLVGTVLLLLDLRKGKRDGTAAARNGAPAPPGTPASSRAPVTPRLVARPAPPSPPPGPRVAVRKQK